MVGYVLGLGDRHGENILFDSTNGDCIHVDFNCLFNMVRREGEVGGGGRGGRGGGGGEGKGEGGEGEEVHDIL